MDVHNISNKYFDIKLDSYIKNSGIIESNNNIIDIIKTKYKKDYDYVLKQINDITSKINNIRTDLINYVQNNDFIDNKLKILLDYNLTKYNSQLKNNDQLFENYAEFRKKFIERLDSLLRNITLEGSNVKKQCDNTDINTREWTNGLAKIKEFYGTSDMKIVHRNSDSRNKAPENFIKTLFNIICITDRLKGKYQVNNDELPEYAMEISKIFSFIQGNERLIKGLTDMNVQRGLFYMINKNSKHIQLDNRYKGIHNMILNMLIIEFAFKDNLSFKNYLFIVNQDTADISDEIKAKIRDI